MIVICDLSKLGVKRTLYNSFLYRAKNFLTHLRADPGSGLTRAYPYCASTTFSFAKKKTVVPRISPPPVPDDQHPVQYPLPLGVRRPRPGVPLRLGPEERGGGHRGDDGRAGDAGRLPVGGHEALDAVLLSEKKREIKNNNVFN